jgi:hypothetical protein
MQSIIMLIAVMQNVVMVSVAPLLSGTATRINIIITHAD